jgi:GMP synthase-like glutamine amidotransferase
MNKAVRIAVIDSVPKIHWQDDEGITDGEKFVDLLAAQNEQADFDIFYASEYQFPQSLDGYDGYMLSGSPSSVHDNFDWIHQLGDLIIDANNLNKRIVASCFGHQLVAKTFGGRVEKNEQGWLIGNYNLNIKRRYDWMLPQANNTGIYHFNKERVTRLPEQATSFADSDDYPDFAYTIGDNILCLQGHPEQPKRAMKNFMKAVDGIVPENEKHTAHRMIENGEPDADIWGKWMMRFFLL